jgi:hypothetical protein
MLGPDQPVILHLLDIEPAKQALEGVKMELLDAAFPLLHGTSHHTKSLCSIKIQKLIVPLAWQEL